MFVLSLNQVQVLPELSTVEFRNRKAIRYQERVFILDEVHQGLQTAAQKCRQFLDQNVLAIVVDHGQGNRASLWSEVNASAHLEGSVARPQPANITTEAPSLDALVSCFQG